MVKLAIEWLALESPDGAHGLAGKRLVAAGRTAVLDLFTVPQPRSSGAHCILDPSSQSIHSIIQSLLRAFGFGPEKCADAKSLQCSRMGLRLSFRPRIAVNTFFHEVPRNEKPFLATAQARQGGVEAPYRRRGSITDTRRSNHQLGGAVAMGGSTTRSILGSLKASVRPRLFRAARHMSPQTPTSCSLHKHCSPHSLPPCNSSTPVRLVVTRYLQ